MSEERQKHWEIWGAAVVVTLAVVGGLFFKGFTGETLTDVPRRRRLGSKD